ncbi:energy transducer TonB [Rhodoferax saidenbachensis]|uniref:energy transducer TonB n=1 Tax=Rhodoferax saidenbachensis TaxID=1484693 RepID=UPI0038F5D698
MKPTQLIRSVLDVALSAGLFAWAICAQYALAEEPPGAPGTEQSAKQPLVESERVERRKQEFKVTPISLAYVGRLRTEVIRNLVYKGEVEGVNPTDVEVRTAADGVILDFRIVKSSGTLAWDDAVLGAIKKIDRLPLDGFGRVPPIIVFHMLPAAVPGRY